MKGDIRKETFDGTFPFKPNFKEINGFQMHYVDEGEGEPVVCVHGEPMWGYLYRKFIPPLAKSNRVIVPDHMGFGKSDTPQDKPYTLAQHADNFTKLLLELDLRNTTLIFQDWGGPISLGFATNNSDRVKRLVVMNTYCFVLPAGTKTWISNMEEKGIYEDSLGDMASFIPRMLSRTLVRATATETMIRAYTAPFPDRASCIGAVAFPRDIPVGDYHPSADTMRSIQKKLGLLKDKAKIIIWGMQDPILPKIVLDWWKKVYPGTKSHELSEAGHFLQEDTPEKIVTIITDFLRKNP